MITRMPSPTPRRDAPGRRVLYRLNPLALVVICLLASCGTSREAYDVKTAYVATVPNFEDLRAYLDGSPGSVSNPKDWRPSTHDGSIDYLALSSGGAGGAFSVGILSEWSRTGRRPEFDIVSGVSTGALIAPFAFLGPRYDEKLKTLYTTGLAKDLYAPKALPVAAMGNSLLTQEPLRALVQYHLDRQVMDAIAEEHRRGRRLFVLTTNLDYQRAVVWNVGAIAATGHPEALKLIQDVVIASASVPGLFPPVFIKAGFGERMIEEMHVDGGASTQLLTLPETLLSKPAPRKAPIGKATLYVIVNNALMPEFATTKNKAVPIMARAYAILIKSQTKASLTALFAFANQAGIKLQIASIDEQIPYDVVNPFDPAYMRAVFELGRHRQRTGTLWKNHPFFPARDVPEDEGPSRSN